MGKYQVLQRQIFRHGSYCLLPLRQADLLSIMAWRNVQLDVLRQAKKLTADDQEKYYRRFIEPSYGHPSPSIILFSFLLDRSLIGYGGLTNIDWPSKRAEISFLLDPRRTKNEQDYEKDFSVFLNLIKVVAFRELKFNRLFAETFDIRPHHLAILEKNGFKLEGRMKEHVLIKDRYVDSLIHGCLRKDDV